MKICDLAKTKVLHLWTPALLFLLLVASCASKPDSSAEVAQTVEPIIAAGEMYCPPFPDTYSEREMVAGLSPKGMTRENEAVGEGEAAGQDGAIPLVEPRKTEPRRAYVEPAVRVKIFGEASLIKLGSQGELTLRFGENAMKISSGSPIQFKSRSARVSVRSYTVGIATFGADEYQKAVRFGEKWKTQGYTVRLIKAGESLVQKDGSVADTTVYWVALGKFKEKSLAEKFRDKMFRRGISSWVIDESVLGPRGNIEIADAQGAPRAYADSRIIVTGETPIKLFDVPFGHGFWDSGNCEDRNFQSPIEVIVDKQGRLAVINELKMEEYVKGILPVEIRLTAPEEAMKAQAVAARTEALAKLGVQHLYDPYDFCASQHCQEFGGLARRTTRTDTAVDATRGRVLMRGGKMVDAVYSANCGGHSESNENVWSSRPDACLRAVSDLYSNPGEFSFPLSSSQMEKWLGSVPKAYCAETSSARKSFRWKVRYSAKKMDDVIRQWRNLGSVRDIRVLERGISGRAMRIRIVGSNGSQTVNKELQIRRVLGGLKSSMFIIDIKRDSSGNPISFTFIGGGWGHGVGMCQSGAEGMARKGFKYTAILKHYFSNADVKSLYE